jgi:hypothetical protein
MGVLNPSGNGLLYVLRLLDASHPMAAHNVGSVDCPPLAFAAPSDATLWHNRSSHLLHAKGC